MSYAFLDLAQSQPDLQDIVEYLQKPLLILEDLNRRYQKMQLTSKTSYENMEIHLDCDKLVHKLFPDLIEQYCQFSLQYRNEHIIKEEKLQNGVKRYTAKELLLKNIGKLIEETEILEERFNETNRSEFLVHNRLASSLGKQPTFETILQPELESAALPNQFSYQNFVTENASQFFKHEIAETLDIANTDEIDNETVTYSGGGFSLLDLLLVLGFVFMTFMGTFVIYDKVQSKQQVINMSHEITEINAYAKNAFSNHLNSLNNDTLKQVATKDLNHYISHEQFVDTYGNPLQIRSQKNHVVIGMNDINAQSCQRLAMAEKEQGNGITINGKIIEGSDFSACTNENNALSIEIFQ